jgi:23S rRNA pseudouridine1911/1915/1917 synthase
LAKQFKDRTIYKQYLALVHGEVRNETGRIETEYGRHPVHRKKMAVLTVSAGENPNRKLREAITDYRVIERYRGYTLLSVEIKTGRTHQIRVHLTHLGYPIVGDPLYGHRREEFKVSGPMLHSSKLGFVHPRTGEYLEFYRPAPEDLQAILKKLPKK